MLRRSADSTEEAFQDIIGSTFAVVFLGTPHRGSATLANAGDVFRQAASVLLRVDSNATILRALGADSPELELGRESFITQWRVRNFAVKTFQEALPLTGINVGALNELVVQKESSTLDDPREHAETIEANHMTMCKFSGPSDPGYIQVGGELKGFVDEIIRKQERKAARKHLLEAERVRLDQES